MAKRKFEKAKDLPNDIKQAMIEGLYRIGWDATKIINETGIPQATVYQNIERYEKRGTQLNDASIKSRAISSVRKYGSSSAAKKFTVDMQRIEDWMKGNWGLWID